MKTREQILSIRKQSGIKFSREGSWFENSEVKESPVSGRNSLEGKRISNYNETYLRNSLESSERNRNKMQGSFIVDWQMPDTF